jgi:N-methylhydantoinase B
MGALAQALPGVIPAASQGTMNNVTFGGEVDGRPFAYYETLGGGAGAGPQGPGGSGLHVHMSNTRNTPVESLENTFPIRIELYALRDGSGGEGLHDGGRGLVRRIRFLAPATVTITSERRIRQPYALKGAAPGKAGTNLVEHEGQSRDVGGKASLPVNAGDVVTIKTPGGGGWGQPSHSGDGQSVDEHA